MLPGPQIPAQPSGKIMWTVRQSFDAVTKVQHRLTAHVQRVLHDQTMNALAAIDRLVDLLGWVRFDSLMLILMSYYNLIFNDR